MGNQLGITVGKPRAVYIQNRPHPATLLVNISAAPSPLISAPTLYLGEEASDVEPAGNGVALGPGSNTVWPEDKGLYVATVGSAGLLSVEENAEGILDAAAIAAQINVAGIPPVDKFTQVTNFSLTGNGVTPALALSLGNVSAFQSLRIFAWFSRMVAGVANPPSLQTLQLSWNSDAAGTVNVATDFVDFYDDNSNGGTYLPNRAVQVDVPVRGPYLSIALVNTPAATQLVRVLTYGSYRARNRISVRQGDGYWGQGGLGGQISDTAGGSSFDRAWGVFCNPALGAGAVVRESIPSRSGLASIDLSVLGNVSPPGIDFYLRLTREGIAGTDRGMLFGRRFWTFTNFDREVGTLVLPNAPVEVVLRNRTAAALAITSAAAMLSAVDD